MNGQVVTKLSFGTKLERIAKNEAGWSVVVYEGKQYYLSSDYVTTEDITGSSFVALEEAINKTVTADVLKKRTAREECGSSTSRYRRSHRDTE
jgi:uncharacterized protein YgiM (DUF1202 family)